MITRDAYSSLCNVLRRLLLRLRLYAVSDTGEALRGDTVSALPRHQGGPASNGRLVYRLASRVLSPSTRQLIWDHVSIRSLPVLARRVNKKHLVVPVDEGGVNVTGWLRHESGLGEAARSTVRGLLSVGMRIHAQVLDTGAPPEIPRSAAVPGRNEDKIFSVHIVHLNPWNSPGIEDFLVSPAIGDQYKIGYWFWETDFPDKWQAWFSFFDEVWTGSSFCQSVISPKSPVPVTRIPCNVAPDIPAGILRTTFGLPESPFMFLFVANAMSGPERKNPTGVCEAYQREFGRNSRDVHLVLLLTNLRVRPDLQKALKKYVDNNTSIHLLDRHLDRQSLWGLMNACDCYVSLHRSEGFGFPLAEAMFMGKPVIATGWSGNMDFMTSTNSLPVRCAVVENRTAAHVYPSGCHWAEPDIEHAGELMRKVALDPERGKRIGIEGQKEIRQNYSPAATGQAIKDRLREIYGYVGS